MHISQWQHISCTVTGCHKAVSTQSQKTLQWHKMRFNGTPLGRLPSASSGRLVPSRPLQHFFPPVSEEGMSEEKVGGVAGKQWGCKTGCQRAGMSDGWVNRVQQDQWCWCQYSIPLSQIWSCGMWTCASCFASVGPTPLLHRGLPLGKGANAPELSPHHEMKVLPVWWAIWSNG